MTLFDGKPSQPRRPAPDDESIDLTLVFKVGAVLGAVWLALVGVFFGLRRLVPPEGPLEKEAVVHDEKPPTERLGMTPQGSVPEEGSKWAHEPADLHPEKVVGVALVLALVVVISLLALGLLFHIFERAHPDRTSEAEPVVTAADIPPQPGVVPAPGLELLKVREEEDQHLDHYGWVDASHTTARVPIERAMILWVQNYSPPALPTAQTPALPMPPASTNGPAATTAVAPGQTELDMRQEKATEGPHVP
jgi:hypothetical protein